MGAPPSTSSPRASEASWRSLATALDSSGETQDGGSGTGDDPNIAAYTATSAEAWLALARWAKQTTGLQPWQHRIAADIGTRLARGHAPSAKQAVHGARILEKARELGFQDP
jgi:hypothetical protein